MSLSEPHCDLRYALSQHDDAAKDANGEYAHIRWRKWPDSDYPTAEEHEEYWALMSTDDPFEPIAWVPTRYTYDDMTKVYG